MPGLDFFTMSTVVAALAVINTLALIVVWRINPTVPGLDVWSLSQTLHVCAWVLSVMVIQGVMRGPFYTVINNSLNLASMIFMLEGALRFRGFGLAESRRLLVLTAVLTAVVISLLNREMVTRRYLWHDAICVLCLTATALTMMWRTAPHQRVVHGMAAGFMLLMAAAASWRWMVALTLPDGEPFPYYELNSLIFTFVALCGLGWVYGLMLSVNMRVRQEVQTVGQIDPLTELSNRRHLEAVLGRALARLDRGGPGFGLAFFDLDQFKSINDRYGHGGGDAMLCAVADRLREGLRSSDEAARIGGDEFVVLFSNLDNDEGLETACTRLRQMVEGPIVLGDDVEPVRISLGAALAPRDGRDIDSLLRHADQAMYTDKRQRQVGHRPTIGDRRVIPFPLDEKGRPRGAAFN
jgi:diguanylate cyclase (GGDEF)-like protein